MQISTTESCSEDDSEMDKDGDDGMRTPPASNHGVTDTQSQWQGVNPTMLDAPSQNATPASSSGALGTQVTVMKREEDSSTCLVRLPGSADLTAMDDSALGAQLRRQLARAKPY